MVGEKRITDGIRPPQIVENIRTELLCNVFVGERMKGPVIGMLLWIRAKFGSSSVQKQLVSTKAKVDGLGVNEEDKEKKRLRFLKTTYPSISTTPF